LSEFGDFLEKASGDARRRVVGIDENGKAGQAVFFCHVGRLDEHRTVGIKPWRHDSRLCPPASRTISPASQKDLAAGCDDRTAQHSGACLRNPQVLDGLSALPHEKAGQREDRNVAPCPVLEHEARRENPRRARITSGDAGLEPEKRESAVCWSL